MFRKIPEIIRYVSMSSEKPFFNTSDWALLNVETITKAYPTPPSANIPSINATLVDIFRKGAGPRNVKVNTITMLPMMEISVPELILSHSCKKLMIYITNLYISIRFGVLLPKKVLFC